MPRTSVDPFLDAVGAFYDAATEPRLFPSALQNVMHLIGADTSYSSIQIVEQPLATLAYKEVGGSDVIALYERSFASQDVWVGALASSKQGRVHLLQDLVSPASLQRTSFFGDFLRPHFNILHAMAIVLPVGRDATVMLGFHRIATHVPFGGEEQNHLQAISRHLARALHLHRRFTEWCANSDVALALDRLQTAIVVVDIHQHIAFENSAARQLLAFADGVTARNNRLVVADSDAANALAAALAAASSGKIGADGKLSVRIPMRRSPRGILASVFPIGSAASQWPSGDRAALVVLIEPGRRIQPTPEETCTLFGLSAAESRLALLLGEGVRLEAAAQLLSISRNTARNQLAAIFAKMHVNRQSDLVALLSSLRAP